MVRGLKGEIAVDSIVARQPLVLYDNVSSRVLLERVGRVDAQVIEREGA